MNDKIQLTREEFERSISQELTAAIQAAKQMRDKIRLLEKVIDDKESKIKDYRNIFAELEKEIIEIQSKLFAGGTS